MIAAVAALLALAAVAGAIAWSPKPAPRVIAAIGFLVAAGVVATLAHEPSREVYAGLGALATLAAVAAGGPLTVLVFALAHAPGHRGAGQDETRPLLRGGAWIGALERFAICATVTAGFPEGLAIVLAIKGLARYPELHDSPEAAELFIIGTCTSVLWAALCAVVVLLTRWA